jgi:hypothetical protein
MLAYASNFINRAFAGLYRRWYNPQAHIDMLSVHLKDRAKSLQLSERRQRSFKPALDHFRLTRFGWEHKRAGAEGERRRNKAYKARVLSRKIAYVSPRDYRTMRIYFPHVHVRPLNAPVDTNINHRFERNLLPSHIG